MQFTVAVLKPFSRRRASATASHSRYLPSKHRKEEIYASLLPDLASEITSQLSSLWIRPDTRTASTTSPTTLSRCCPPKATASVSDSTKSFTCFPNLPFELRVKIWKAALQTRLIVVWPITESCERGRPPKADRIPLLHVSKESREETLRLYKAICAPSPNIYTNWIDPKVDTLFMDDGVWHFSKAIPKLDLYVLGNLENLALDCESVFFPWFPLRSGLLPILSFRKLKTLTLVLKFGGGGKVLYDAFRMPITEWRASGVQIRDHTLLTEQAKYVQRNSGRPISTTYNVAQYVLCGMERLLPVLDGFAKIHPQWKVPAIEIKALGS